MIYIDFTYIQYVFFFTWAVFPIHVVTLKCKAGFENIAKWCFSIHLESKSLSKSREICEKTGGNMVLLDEHMKLNLLRKYIQGKLVNQLYSIETFLISLFSSCSFMPVLFSSHLLHVANVYFCHRLISCCFFFFFTEKRLIHKLYVKNKEVFQNFFVFS